MARDPLQPYLDHLAHEKGMSPRTVEAYGRDVARFLDTAVVHGVLSAPGPEKEWKKLNGQRGLVRAHLAGLRRESLAPASVDRHLAAVRSFFRYLHLQGWVKIVPGNLKQGRGGRERLLPKDLNLELAEQLIQMPDVDTLRGLRDRALLEMIYGLGLRLAEVVGLNLGSLDLVSDQVRVLGKGNRERILPLGGCAREALVNYLRIGSNRQRGWTCPTVSSGPSGRYCPSSRDGRGGGSRGGRSRPGSRSMRGNWRPCPAFLHIPCGIPSRHICWMAGRVSGWFRNSSDTRISRRPRSIRIWGGQGCGKAMTRPIPGRRPRAARTRRTEQNPVHQTGAISMKVRSTTVLAVLRDGKGAIGSDGQVTLGNTAVKHGAVKVRKLFGGKVLVGFAGGAADAFTLFEKFEGHLERYRGHLKRATVELAREWRSDRILRRLEAMMVVMDTANIFVVSGNGDIIESDDNLTSIGSGGPYALAAGRALMQNTDLPAAEICRKGLTLAGEICIYTNQSITLLEIDGKEGNEVESPTD